ncbi:MAG: hypothetical protein MUC97_13560 [Bernardetiaceae bacterium]|nr:hypothetical protein [Bernardetiaceae bacterium]
MSKKHSLVFGQQLQITPDLSRIQPIRLRRDRDFGEIDFIDDRFLPRGQGYDDDDDDGDEDDDGIGDDDDDDNDNDGVDDDDDQDDDDPTVGAVNPGMGTPPGNAEGSGKRRGDDAIALRSATSVAWEWELAKNLVLSNEYVLNYRPGQRLTHFFVTELSYQLNLVLKTLTLDPFVRLHNEGGQTARDGFQIATHLRGGTQLRLKMSKKLASSLGAEVFYRLDGPNSKFNRVRATLGADYRISKVQRLRLSYDLQQRLNVTRAERAGVLTLGYRLVF